MKILLVVPPMAPGVESALQNLNSIIGGELRYLNDILYNTNSNQFKKMAERTGIVCRKTSVISRFYVKLQKELELFNLNTFRQFGDNIILGGWGYPYNVLTDKLNKIDIYPSVMWCSTIGQAELTSTEVTRFAELLNYLKQRKVKHLLLHRRPYNECGHVKNTVFLPHTIDIPRIKIVRENIACYKNKLQGLNADLFCSYRNGKNVLAQIFAAKLARTHFTLHVNFNNCHGARRVEVQSLLKTLDIKNIVFHSWLEQSQYWNFLSCMDISLQVTHTESFNYAVCERMILGIPTLTTHNIWLVSEDTYLKQHLCVNAPDTPREISDKIDLILSNKSLHQELSERSKQRIKEVAQKNNSEAIQCVNRIFKLS